MSSTWAVEPIPPQLLGTPTEYKGTDFSAFPRVSDHSLKSRVWSGPYAAIRVVGTALILLVTWANLFGKSSGGPPWWLVLLGCVFFLGLLYTKTREHAHMALLAEEIARVNRQRTESSIADAAHRLNRAQELHQVARRQALKLMQAQSKVHQLCATAEASFRENHFRHYWEAIETAVYEMDQMSKLSAGFGETATQYRDNLNGRKHNLPTFAELTTNLPRPDPRATVAEFDRVLRLGETNRDFAGYLNERVTIKVLVEGFKTLAEAVDHIGERLVSAISSMERTILAASKR